MFLKDNRQTWDKLTEIVENYLEENKDHKTPVVRYEPATKLKSLLNLNLDENGVAEDLLLEEIKKYLKYSVRTTHPQFNNQLNGGFNFEALLAEIISFISNTSMATYEIAPVATLIERKLIEELNKKIGYHDGGGIMLTGGSNANMLAIHCARNTHLADVKFRGNQGKDLCIFVSEEAHYSFKKAVMLMGIGLDNLILVKANKDGKMQAEDLENKIIAVKEAGRTPIMIASTCGTTVKGAFDPIEENQKIAEKYDLWHHIDGAWGGAALFSKKIRDYLGEAHKADSFTFDAHKLLGTGLITSFLLTKREGVIKAANSGGGSEYLFHHYENADFDTGTASLQCGRKVDSLKFWLSWKAWGHRGISEFVDEQLDKMHYFANYIKEHPRLKLIAEPEYLNVCFQVIPPSSSFEINQFNVDLRFRMVKDGRFLVNYSSDEDGTIYFRHVFCNNVTQKRDLKYFLDELVKLAE
ncbi:MAG: pyridoxal-dependent decarboxylase [Bacteriovoracaceae bacterium]|jgi:glutamate/tyrosine decarboxylase-like PLP-dependent enzyme|nr:glutamate decarboxylase [Halobacteriovoraceae bacterium]MDP7321759.1 pyridoxal-dependent decarboxylase [Bacteriovoracaceae bacterium]